MPSRKRRHQTVLGDHPGDQQELAVLRPEVVELRADRDRLLAGWSHEKVRVSGLVEDLDALRPPVRLGPLPTLAVGRMVESIEEGAARG